MLTGARNVMAFKRFALFLRPLLLAGILNFSQPFAAAEVNTELSRMLYQIPTPPGMEMERLGDSFSVRSGPDREQNIRQVVLRSKGDQKISALEILEFFDSYFIPKGFNRWGQEEELSGRYQPPSVVTKGNAYIWSQGSIGYHIPQDGNFIVFLVHQTRIYNVRGSEELISKIQNVFKEVSDQLNYKYAVHEQNAVSDWQRYVINECYVTRAASYIEYQEPERGSFGDNGNYRFYFLVFPTREHAIQWRDFELEEIQRRSPYPNYLVDGLGMPPIVISNILVKYAGEARDAPNAELRDKLTDSLSLVAKEFESQGAHNTKQPRE